MLSMTYRIIFKPTETWKSLADLPEAKVRSLLMVPLVLALLPAIAWYYGTTQIGWTVAGDSLTRLTKESAMAIAICLYFAQLSAIAIIGYFIHWMSQTYGADTSILRGIALTGLIAIPLLLAGGVGFYPILWLDMIIAILATIHAVYLLYKGIPLALNIPPERGFLYASAVAGVVLVMVISLMGATLILWDLGFEPVFQD